MRMKSFVLTIGLIAFLTGWVWAQPQPSLIATEEEVRQFFKAYGDCYNRKAVDEFLALFSPKAIQNRKEGIAEIKKAYTLFFNQSLDLNYRLESLQYEIYENAVEAKARYAILQKPHIGGKEREWTGKIRWILTKEDGRLKILSLIYQHEKVP